MENPIPDIFTVPLVHPSVDLFWDERSLPEIGNCDTLIISTPFASGSEEEQQLNRMMAACKLTPDQYQVVQVHSGDAIAWYQLKAKTMAQKVLLLGVSPAQLGINALMTLHEINHFNGAQWMVTATLPEIAANPQLKQHIWVNMLKKVYFPSE